jgi:hypothetical protein
MLVAGDLTNADLIPPTKRVQQVKEIFSIMESFKIPYYYVWGTPFREGTLASRMDGNSSDEIEHFLCSLNLGKHLKEEEPVKLGRYWLTSSPERMPKNAIFLKHHYRRLIPKALLQLDGHLHYGQHVFNYLNLGGKLKDFSCPDHREEGIFYIPFYWKKCPICYDPREAIVKEKKK